GLERDNRVHLRLRRACRLRVAERGGLCLVRQVVGQVRPRERLATVPHHGGEEWQVRRGQRAAEQRQLGRTRVAVRVIDGVERELRVRGDADADTHEAFREQQRVR